MTVYFPLVVHGAMLIEPTESESKPSLDQFIATLRGLAEAAKAGDAARFKDAPRFAPRRRLDETKAAREPRLQVDAAGGAQGGGGIGQMASPKRRAAPISGAGGSADGGGSGALEKPDGFHVIADGSKPGAQS